MRKNMPKRFPTVALLGTIVAATFLITLYNCFFAIPSFATPEALRRQFPDQFARIDYYAQNFSRLIHATPFPPEGADALDRSLFHIPAILDFYLLDVDSGVGLHPESWANAPLNRKTFWLTSDTAPVKIGKGTTTGGRKLGIVVHQTVLIEQTTGRRLRCTLVCDLSELEKLWMAQNQGAHATKD